MKGIIVAPEPLAAEAGAEMLRCGGNAADAAAAAAFAQCVTDPLMCGIGGTALGLVRRGPDGAVRFVDASVTIGSVPPPNQWDCDHAGRSETIGRYIVRGEGNQMGHASVMVPGFVRGIAHLLARFGSSHVPWRAVIEPAIRLAREGFAVYPYVARFWADNEDRPGYPSLARKMACTPDGRRIFLKADGSRYREGERFVQADLAATLDRIAGEGPDEFYEGETARRIADDFSSHGGLFTAEDLHEFQSYEGEPVEGVYRGRRVIGAPPPASGPQLIEMLQVAEALGLGTLEHNGSNYLDLTARLMTATFMEHAALKCDPPHSAALASISCALDRDHARRLASALRERRPEGVPQPIPGAGTTHVSAADEEGTVVSFTHSIGSLGGSGVVTPGTGILFNNFIGHFNPLPGHPDSIVPGKRGGGGCPALVFEGSRPRMVIGAPGGSRLITAVFQVMLNVFDRQMHVARAVAAPRFHAEEPGLLFVEPAFSDAIVAALGIMGYRVEQSTYMSRVQAVAIETDGAFHPGADPRGGAGAVVVDR